MSRFCVSLILASPIMLLAQAPRDVVPLKYWPAPLYWQPTQAERLVAAKSELFSVASPQAAPPTTASANALVFVAMTPCRLVDTRAGFGFSGAFGPPSLAGGATRGFPIQTSTTCTIPSNAQAYSFNITIVPPAAMYYLTIWPVGASQPNVSTLNDLAGTVIANAAIVPAGNDGSGSVNVFVSNSTDFILDINGYYAPQTGITLAESTPSAPALSFSGDPTTGVFSGSAGSVSMATDGVSRLTVYSTGDVDIPGSLRKNGTLFMHNIGTGDTAVGLSALNPASTGTNNTAFGNGTLAANTTGNSSTAVGNIALGVATTACCNTAIGGGALASDTTGSYNTAVGQAALNFNTTASNNTAIGRSALTSLGTGSNNTAVGSMAALGTTGSDNTALGQGALVTNTTGSGNIAIGYAAAQSVSSGNSNNIEIGSQGASGDSATIRIGTSGTQTSFYAAGVYGATTSGGIPVLINSNGLLGTSSSSRRYKEDIRDMEDASSGLLRLRPVTFRYKQPYEDGSKPIDYGLIAEEVAEVYPDLVVKNADGQIETVQYQKLTPMLLNELQKQHQESEQQKSEIAQQRAELTGQAQAIRALEAQLAAVKELLSGPK